MMASVRNYMAVFAAAALVAVAVSACGGGGKPDTDNGNGPTLPPMPTHVDVDLSDLMSGFAATAGTVRIRAGEHADHGDIRFQCAAGGDDCVVEVAVDDGTITAMARTSGGRVTAVDVPPMYDPVDLSDLMSGYTATAGTITIEAGEHVDRGDIRFRCAAGGEDCTVLVMVDNGTITAGALTTGGMVTAVDVPPMYDDVDLSDLMSGYTATAGTITIEAGEHVDRGDIRFRCAAGGEDCTVMVMVDNGTITAGALTTGGMVTAVDVPDMYVDVILSGLKSGFDAAAGRLEIDAGADEDYGDIRFSCASGPDDCVVMVMVANDGTITAEALATGGTVTAGDATVDVDLSSLKPGYDADADTLEINAGADVDHGDIRFSCASGPDDCLVMVMVADDGTITAWARPSGGTVTAGDATVDVDLSSLKPGYDADADTLEINAGADVDHGDIRFACAAGGENCLVMVMVAGDGTITAWARPSGGTVTAGDATVDVDLKDVTVGFWADAIMMLEIVQGKSKDHGDIRFSCAAGRYDCTVMVMVAGDGTITATSIGGEVTASDAGNPNTKRDEALELAIKPPPSPPHSTYAPSLGDDGAAPGYTAMTNAVVADIDGWTSSVQKLQTPAVMGVSPAMTDTLVIYSNTPYEMEVGFAVKHMLNTNPDSNNDPQSLIVDLGNLSQVSDVSAFPSTPNLNNANVAMNVGGTGYPGKFDGADGEYWCDTVGGCDISTDADGNLSAVTGDLYFTPAAGAQVDVPDPDYMYFGYWLRESEDSNGDPTFEIAGVYGGPEPSPIGDVRMLEGTATYDGSATGYYVRRWTDANNEVLRRRTGQFTADVALTANFSGGVLGLDQQSISGTISNFMDGMKNKSIDSSWRLALQRADFNSTVTLGALDDFMGGTQAVDENDMAISSAAAGDWNGRFFGEVVVDSDPVAQGNQSILPSGVAGTFDGHFNNGDVIGAYGAERDE